MEGYGVALFVVSYH